MHPETDTAGSTRERLLEAACEIFADHGYRRATVRDICQRAGSNVAAVNYHFGGKEQLYAAVLLHAFQCVHQGSPPVPADDGPVERRLNDFVRSMLGHAIATGRESWYGRLMQREMMEPTNALDLLVEQSIRPRFNRVTALAEEIAGRPLAPHVARLCAASIVGQCVHFCQARAVMSRVLPGLTYDHEDVVMLADHITKFCLAALRSLPTEGTDEA